MKKLKSMIDKRSDYDISDIVKTLFIMSDGPHGREKLMQELSLKEAPVRTMLRALSKNKLIIVTKNGGMLSPSGKKAIRQIKRKIPFLPLEIEAKEYTDYGLYKKLYNKRFDVIILIKNSIDKRMRGEKIHSVWYAYIDRAKDAMDKNNSFLSLLMLTRNK